MYIIFGLNLLVNFNVNILMLKNWPNCNFARFNNLKHTHTLTLSSLQEFAHHVAKKFSSFWHLTFRWLHQTGSFAANKMISCLISFTLHLSLSETKESFCTRKKTIFFFSRELQFSITKTFTFFV